MYPLNNYLIYLAFGREDYLNEALYSLLSFYKFQTKEDKINVLVYTDNPDYFRKILPENVIYRSMDGQLIRHWKGRLNYIYRFKTKVLQEVCATYQGNFLFVDTDTVFLKNAASLFDLIQSGELLLDACEGKLIDNKGGIAKKTRKFLSTQPAFSVPSDENLIAMNEKFTAWNSGTIGFTNAVCHKLISVEELSDELYAKSKGKVFVVEQIALSYYFQGIQQPKATQSFIHHYWDFKEFRPVLSAFLEYHKNKNLEELIPMIDKIHPQNLAVEKRKYKKLSFLEKQWRKIATGKKWQLPDYKFD